MSIVVRVGSRLTDGSGGASRMSTIAAGGFRYVYMDYKDGEGRERFEYNMSIYGPFLGAAFHF